MLEAREFEFIDNLICFVTRDIDVVTFTALIQLRLDLLLTLRLYFIVMSLTKGSAPIFLNWILFSINRQVFWAINLLILSQGTRVIDVGRFTTHQWRPCPVLVSSPLSKGPHPYFSIESCSASTDKSFEPLISKFYRKEPEILTS